MSSHSNQKLHLPMSYKNINLVFPIYMLSHSKGRHTFISTPLSLKFGMVTHQVNLQLFYVFFSIRTTFTSSFQKLKKYIVNKQAHCATKTVKYILLVKLLIYSYLWISDVFVHFCPIFKSSLIGIKLIIAPGPQIKVPC